MEVNAWAQTSSWGPPNSGSVDKSHSRLDVTRTSHQLTTSRAEEQAQLRRGHDAVTPSSQGKCSRRASDRVHPSFAVNLPSSKTYCWKTSPHRSVYYFLYCHTVFSCCQKAVLTLSLSLKCLLSHLYTTLYFKVHSTSSLDIETASQVGSYFTSSVVSVDLFRFKNGWQRADLPAVLLLMVTCKDRIFRFGWNILSSFNVGCTN